MVCGRSSRPRCRNCSRGMESTAMLPWDRAFAQRRPPTRLGTRRLDNDPGTLPMPRSPACPAIIHHQLLTCENVKSKSHRHSYAISPAIPLCLYYYACCVSVSCKLICRIIISKTRCIPVSSNTSLTRLPEHLLFVFTPFALLYFSGVFEKKWFPRTE